MFTGIIEEIGTIKHIVHGEKSAKLTIAGKVVLEGTKLGDSIAVNGVCLTVTRLAGTEFTADVMAETLRRSSLGQLQPGGRVNLERAMAADGRFGGHMVSGHIDGTGIITSLKQEDNAIWVTISTKPALLRYIVEKGSITIDGVSLTVAMVDHHGFQVSLIPHTARETVLLSRGIGAVVNLENDVIGKYVEKFLREPMDRNDPGQEEEPGAVRQRGITSDFLTQHGF